MSRIETDRTAYLSGINSLLKELGVLKSSFEDRRLIKKICNLVAKRAANISAAVLAGVITKIDPNLSSRHIVAVDGTVYEKYPGFSRNMKFALLRIFGKGSNKIKMVLTKDGSGVGAAVIAAVAKGV
jgi:hexokinase